MIHFVVTSWNEPVSAPENILSLISQAEDLNLNYEVILVCPDDDTKDAVEKYIQQINISGNFKHIRDKRKGKPAALNLVMNYIGDNKKSILILTDGDVYVRDNAVKSLLNHFEDEEVGAVTGRPVSKNKKNNILGYWGNLLADAAHQRRIDTLGKGKFFPLSGYLFAMRNLGINVPNNVLDDIYYSYKINEMGYKLEYEPDALVGIKQPRSVSDWLIQKKRNLRGHFDLDEYFDEPPKVRSFSSELSYMFFPLKYASNIREFLWSLLLYPFRFYLWIRLWWSRVFLSEMTTGKWSRVESTK